MSAKQGRRQNRGCPSPATQAKALRDHNESVNARLLPHLRALPRAMRPAWVERKVKDMVA